MIAAADGRECGAGPPAARFRAAIEYALTGDLRFLSHHDEQRMLTRALRRAAWPLAYSHGFNPHPRLTLPLPRTVGTASLCQLALVELDRDVRPRELFDSLSRVLPKGVELRGVIAPAARGTPHAVQIRYELRLDPADIDRALAGIAQALAARQIFVTRTYGPGKPPRPVEIRAFLTSLNVDGAVLRMHVACSGQASARPNEIVSALGLPGEVYDHRVQRVGVTWDMELAAPEGAPRPAPERTELGTQEDHHGA